MGWMRNAGGKGCIGMSKTDWIMAAMQRTEKRNPLCLCYFPDLAIFDLKFLCQFFVL